MSDKVTSNDKPKVDELEILMGYLAGVLKVGLTIILVVTFFAVLAVVLSALKAWLDSDPASAIIVLTLAFLVFGYFIYREEKIHPRFPRS